MKFNNIFPIALVGSLFFLQSCGDPVVEEKEVDMAPLVKMENVEMKKFIHEIRVQGNIETDKEIILNAEMGGLITSIKVKEGQRVQAGQLIATVDGSVLSSNLAEIQTQLEYAEYMLDKQEELHKRGVGSEFELETARNQVESLKSRINSVNVQRGKTAIKAPFSGVIDQVFAKQGQMAGPASPIVRLVNNNTVDVIATISEKHFAKIKVGTEMNVSFPNYGDTNVILKVTNVGNYIEPTNRTFRIMSTIKNNSFFLPNMLAEVRIIDMEVENGTVIPSVAIMKDQDNSDYVFIGKKYNGKEENDKDLYQVSKVLINVIERFKGETLIEGNILSKEDLIVVKGARGVADKDLVRIK